MKSTNREALSIWIRGVFILCLALAGVAGCKTAPAPVPEGVDLAEKTAPQALFQAIRVTFDEKDIPVDVQSERFLVVTSEYLDAGDRLRKRYTARVIRMKGGASALRVKVEYQRRSGSGSDVRWRNVAGEVLGQRARDAEVELARDIEENFNSWKDEYDFEADTDAQAEGEK